MLYRDLLIHSFSLVSNRLSTVVVDGIYELFNLNFFYTFMPPFCLTRHFSTVQTFAFYPLVAIIFLYVCIRLHASNFRPVVYCWKPFLKCFLRFRRRVDPTTSVIDAFATFILLSYVRLSFVVNRFFAHLLKLSKAATRMAQMAHETADILQDSISSFASV